MRGASTGLVTTTTITHATPIAFAAHELSRSNQSEIALDYLTDSKPNVLFGGARFTDPLTAKAAGYTVVEDRDGMLDLDTEIQDRVWGQFGETYMPYEFGWTGS
jgi:alkaline phosphatase